MEDGLLHAASDGSTWADQNAFGLCLGIDGEPEHWRTANEVEGAPIAFDRSELCGLLAIVEYLNEIAEWKGMPPSVNVYCDNADSIRYASSPYLGATLKWADRRNLDLKIEMIAAIQRSRVTYTFAHMKGH